MKRLLQNIKVAFQALALNKSRSFLTMLGIIIGVGAVVTIMAVGAGAQQSIISNVQSMGTNLLSVQAGRDSNFGPGGGGPPGRSRVVMISAREEDSEETERGDLKLADYEALKEGLEADAKVTAVINNSTTVSYLGVNDTTQITGSTYEYTDLMGYDIAKGRTLTSGDISSASNVAIIGSDYITKNVEEIDERKLHLRLNIKGKDSIAKMSQTFDAMLDKLETSFDSQKLFFQNASHELNTPLTIIKTNIDVLRQNKNATKEECEEVIDIIDNEVKKLSGISDSLLNLSDNKTAGEK